MLILTTGMIRSGSTWSFNICKNLLQSTDAGPVQTAFVETLVDWKAFDDRAVLKCHSLDADSIEWLKTAPIEVRFVYTIRDLFEVCASAYATFNTPPDECLSACERSLAFLQEQREMAPVLLIPYLSIERNPERTAFRVDEFLRLNVDPTRIRAVHQACERGRLKEFVRTFGSIPVSDIRRNEVHTYHLPTLLHHNHFRSDTALPWEDLLNDSQIARAEKIMTANARLFEFVEPWVI
jgi:hypothetical protein